MDSLISWLESRQLRCFYMGTLGIACPGCGFQRALILLLKGQVGESLVQYPPLIPILVMLGFLILHLSFRFPKGALWLKYQFIGCVILVLGNFLVRNILFLGHLPH